MFLAEELSRVRGKPHVPDETREHVKMVAETDETGLNQQTKNCLRAAEMILVAISQWKKLQEQTKHLRLVK